MHSIIIALILVATVTILCLALVSINNRQRKKNANDLVRRFYKLGKGKKSKIFQDRNSGKFR